MFTHKLVGITYVKPVQYPFSETSHRLALIHTNYVDVGYICEFL